MSVTDRELRAELDGDGDVGELVDRLQARAGANLRCVVEYDESGWDARYRREDLQRDEFEIVLEEMKHRVRTAAQAASAIEAPPRTLVSCYDDVSVVHVRCADRRSVAVLLDGDATPRIRSFAREWRELLSE